jgi:UDP-glucose 4-epimerase
MRENKLHQRILLVGSSGNVGRMVLHHWSQRMGESTSVIAQHRDKNRSDGFFWPLLETAGSQLKKQKISTIICLAGVTPETGVDLALNTTIANNVLKAAYTSGVKRILLASSSAVYGAAQGCRENDANNPVNTYGVAKVKMETACAPWRGAGLEICCLRIGNVVGADALMKNITRLNGSKPVSIDCFSDGRGPVRSYIGPKTLAEVLFTLATQKRPLPETLNVASPHEVYMEELAEAASYPFTFISAPASAHQKITLNGERLENMHSFSPHDSDPQSMVLQWKETI